MEALYEAIKNGHLAIVNQLLEDPQIVSHLDDDDSRAFALAVEYGQLAIVSRLLEFPSDLTNREGWENHLLNLAAYNGHLALVQELLERLNHQTLEAAWSSLSKTLFISAAQVGATGIVKRLLEFQNLSDPKEWSVLMEAFGVAAAEGHLGVMNQLLELPNIAGDDALLRRTFCIAAESGQLSLINRLLEFSPQRANAHDMGYDALWSPILMGHLHVINRLLQLPALSVPALRSPFQSAVLMGHLPVINRLLQLPNLSVSALKMAFQNAVFMGHLSVINRLLEFPDVRADRDALHKNLQTAIKNGHLSVINRLLDLSDVALDANTLDIIDFYRAAADNHLTEASRLLALPHVYTHPTAPHIALKLAAENDHLPVINLLLKIFEKRFEEESIFLVSMVFIEAAEKGHLSVINRLLAARQLEPKFLRLVFHQAVNHDRVAIVSRLLEFSSISSQKENLQIALLTAAHSGYLAVTNRLLESLTMPEREGIRRDHKAAFWLLSALWLSAQNGHLSVVNRLLELPYVFAHADAWGNQALRLAAENGHFLLVDRLLELKKVREQAHLEENFLLRTVLQKLEDPSFSEKQLPNYHQIAVRLLTVNKVSAFLGTLQRHPILNGILQSQNTLCHFIEWHVGNSYLPIETIAQIASYLRDLTPYPGLRKNERYIGKASQNIREFLRKRQRTEPPTEASDCFIPKKKERESDPSVELEKCSKILSHSQALFDVLSTDHMPITCRSIHEKEFLISKGELLETNQQVESSSYMMQATEARRRSLPLNAAHQNKIRYRSRSLP